MEYEPFSVSWPTLSTFVPGGSGSAYRLVTTPRTFTDALAHSPAPPLGRGWYVGVTLTAAGYVAGYLATPATVEEEIGVAGLV